MIIGILLLKYVFSVVDKPITILLAQSPILPLLLFATFVYSYGSAGRTKRLSTQKDQRDEKT